jgi:hypothetical protein
MAFLEKELPMRIRIALVSFIVLVIAYALAPQAAYALEDNVVTYTVYYSCHVGPGGCNANGDWYGCLVGEWTVSCYGQWTGWGMRPYTSCAEIVDEETGRACAPDVQGLSAPLNIFPSGGTGLGVCGPSKGIRPF